MKNEFLPQKGNFKNLKVYQIAEIIYDITFIFAHRFLRPGDRTTDQMVQAARSVKQNIAEGSAAATTSSESEIKLTNVARASLQEVLLDFEDYLRVRDLQIWDKNSPKAIATRRVCAARTGSAYFREAVKIRTDETVANIAIVLIHQADVLLCGLMRYQKERFLSDGGIREQMTRARLRRRGSSNPD